MIAGAPAIFAGKEKPRRGSGGTAAAGARWGLWYGVGYRLQLSGVAPGYNHTFDLDANAKGYMRESMTITATAKTIDIPPTE